MGLRRNLFNLLGLFIFALIQTTIMAESSEEEFTDTGVGYCNNTHLHEQLKLVDPVICYRDAKDRMNWMQGSQAWTTERGREYGAPLFHYDECPGEGERAWGPQRAITLQTNVTRPWCAATPKIFPQMIYYDFGIELAIGKISFRNRLEKDHMDNNPTSFEIVASNGRKPGERDLHWDVLRNVTNLVWTRNNEEKEFVIQSSKPSSAYTDFREYSMIGIRVREISGENMACIQNMKFYRMRQYDKAFFEQTWGYGNWDE